MDLPRAYSFAMDWPVYASIAILGVLVVLILISYAINRHQMDRYKKEIEDQSNSVRVFVVDIPHDKVTYFNVTSLSDVKTYTLGEFYQHFPIAEQKKVINWINALGDPGTSAPEFLEVDVQDSKFKRQTFSLLQVEKVDKKKQVIHLLSYLMKFMSSSFGSPRRGLSSIKEYQAAMETNPRKKGVTGAFRFAYKKIADKDKEIDPVAFNQLKNALFPFVTGKRMLLQCSGNELVLVDFRLSDRASELYLFRSGINSISRYLSLNGLLSEIEVRVGVVEHRRLKGEADAIIEQARNTAALAFEGNDKVLLSEKTREILNPLSDSTYRTEVERIINEKRLTYTFRPIYDVERGKTIGYFSKASPKDTYFDSMDELKDYAVRTEDDKILFATVARETIPLFLAERPDETQSLFYPVRLEERGYMLLAFSKLQKAKSAHIVFLFTETDFRDKLDTTNPDAFVDDITAIKAKGYEVGLFLDTSDLQLPPSIYWAFDYFVCGFAFAGSAAEMDALVRSKLHALVEKLLKFGKPIVATDIEGWASIELLVRSGINFISAEVFAPFDVMMNPISPKSLKRIRDMKD